MNEDAGGADATEISNHVSAPSFLRLHGGCSRS